MTEETRDAGSVQMELKPAGDATASDKERLAWQRFMDEGSLDALHDLLDIWKGAGREDRVCCLLEMLVASEWCADLELRALMQVYLGQSYERTGEFESAAREYRQALALEPDNPWTLYYTLNNLGYSLNVLGEYAEGERLCRTATTVNPRRANAWKNLGISLEGQGRHAEAFDAWVEATRVNPTDTRAYAMLENLIADHPALLREPEACAGLERCRAAVAMVRELSADEA